LDSLEHPLRSLRIAEFRTVPFQVEVAGFFDGHLLYRFRNTEGAQFDLVPVLPKLEFGDFQIVLRERPETFPKGWIGLAVRPDADENVSPVDVDAPALSHDETILSFSMSDPNGSNLFL